MSKIYSRCERKYLYALAQSAYPHPSPFWNIPLVGRCFWGKANSNPHIFTFGFHFTHFIQITKYLSIYLSVWQKVVWASGARKSAPTKKRQKKRSNFWQKFYLFWQTIKRKWGKRSKGIDKNIIPFVFVLPTVILTVVSMCIYGGCVGLNEVEWSSDRKRTPSYQNQR